MLRCHRSPEVPAPLAPFLPSPMGARHHDMPRPHFPSSYHPFFTGGLPVKKSHVRFFHAALRFFHAAPPLCKPRPPTPKRLNPPSANRPYYPGASRCKQCNMVFIYRHDTKSPAFTYSSSSGEKGYRIRVESPNRYSIRLKWQPFSGESLLNLIELPFNSCNCYRGIVSCSRKLSAARVHFLFALGCLM